MCVDPGTAIPVASLLVSTGSAVAEHEAAEDKAEATKAAAKKAREVEVRDLTIKKIEETREQFQRGPEWNPEGLYSLQ